MEQQAEAPDALEAFGSLAYERVLSEPECRKLERVQRRLAAALDGAVHVWVRDARPFAHGKTAPVEPIALRLHPSLPVAEVRDMVQERYEQMSNYREATDGPLNLLFEQNVLENGKLLAEYLDAATNRTWAKPYAGILWVVPFRASTKRRADVWVG